MATVYRLRLEDPNGPNGGVKRDKLTYAEWESQYSHFALLTIKDTSGNYHDVTEWVSELQISHNELDREGSGRDTETGKMKRTYVATKHTLNVKILDGVPQKVARYIFDLVDSVPPNKLNFYVLYQWPCEDNADEQLFYCSTVNFGAQRWNKSDKYCRYYGMNFNLIQW